MTEGAQERMARPVEVIVWVETQDDDAAYEAVQRMFPGADGTGSPVVNGVAVQYVTIVGTDTGLDPLPLS